MLPIEKITSLSAKITTLQKEIAELALMAKPLQDQLEEAETELKRLVTGGGSARAPRAERATQGVPKPASLGARILSALADGDKTVRQLSLALGVDKQKVHNAGFILKKKGLITQPGYGVYHAVSPDDLG